MTLVELRDYNGPGEWSLEEIRRRYQLLAKELHLPARELVPIESRKGEIHWIYPVMFPVIEGIEHGDAACIELGVSFVESDHRQAFGRILHSNTARALRRSNLTPVQVDRLRTRILGMLVAGQVPHEFKEYAKLLRAIGLKKVWEQARARVDSNNPYVMRYVGYFEACYREESPANSLQRE